MAVLYIAKWITAYLTVCITILLGNTSMITSDWSFLWLLVATDIYGKWLRLCGEIFQSKILCLFASQLKKGHEQNIKSTWIVRHNKIIITLYLTWQHNPTNDDLATIFPHRRACPTHSVYVRGRSYDDAIINYAVHMKAYGMFSNSL